MKARRSYSRPKRAARAPGAFFSKDGGEGKSESFFAKSHDSPRSKGLPTSGGSPLPADTKSEMEAAFGRNLSAVRIHTDAHAAEANQGMHAQALAVGQHIFFNRGQFNPTTKAGKRLLAHELTHTLQQSGQSKGIQHQTTSPQIAAQGLLTTAQEKAAITFNHSNYDERSRRILQDIVGVARDSLVWSQTVEAIAAFQSANGITPDGMASQPTLEFMLRNRAGAGLPEHGIQLVVDFFNLNLSDVLTISLDPSIGFIGLANTTFEPGGRVIRLGPLSFLSAGLMRAVILRELAVPRPAAPPLTPLPTHLTPAQESSAVWFNRSHYRDPRSIQAIQNLVGAAVTGVFDRDTAERIADFQFSNGGLIVDGKAGEQTLRAFVTQLAAANQQNTAIWLLMDFFKLSTHNSLLDIRFDAALTTANASTSGVIPGPSMIRVGPSAFAQGFEGLVHTIAHELEHVRQRRVGILNQDVREFLGEAIEIVSAGMPPEGLAGFFNDARRALFHWNRIPAAEQRIRWGRFTQVRNQVRRRFNAASAADQLTHQATMNGYNAVVRP